MLGKALVRSCGLPVLVGSISGGYATNECWWPNGESDRSDAVVRRCIYLESQRPVVDGAVFAERFGPYNNVETGTSGSRRRYEGHFSLCRLPSGNRKSRLKMSRRQCSPLMIRTERRKLQIIGRLGLGSSVYRRRRKTVCLDSCWPSAKFAYSERAKSKLHCMPTRKASSGGGG